MTFAQSRLGASTCGLLSPRAVYRIPHAPVSHRLPPLRLPCRAVAYDERPAVARLPQVQTPLEPPAKAPTNDEDSDEAVEVDTEPLSPGERRRREKISAANRGRRPWNKGIHLSDEIRLKIAQRTREAMARPEVRAKLRRGNRMRPPHREEVRERIRVNLKARSDRIRALLAEQAPQVIAEMRENGSQEEQTAVDNFPKAEEIFVKLAWRVIKDDHQRAFEQWQNNDHGLREQFVQRLVMLKAKHIESLEKSRQARARRSDGRVKAQSSTTKLRLALSTQEKLSQAQSKLEAAEGMLVKLQSAKALLTDPAKLSALAAAETQAEGVIGKLRQQVDALNDAMAPLQQYLKPKDSAMDAMMAAAATRANALEVSNGASTSTNEHASGSLNGAVNGAAVLNSAAVNGTAAVRVNGVHHAAS